ncbi:sigma 54-interacting transcriptional regulator [bacterium]|nr:sigma 54-interacting transcriptional regulator [bacterium]
MEIPTIKVFKEVNRSLDLIIPAALFQNEFSIDWLIQLTGEKASHILDQLDEACNDGILKRKSYGRFFFSSAVEQKKWRKKLSILQTDIFRKKIIEILWQELPEEKEKAVHIVNQLHSHPDDLEKCEQLFKAGDLLVKSHKIEESINCYTSILRILSNLPEDEAVDLYIKTVLAYSKIADVKFDISQSLELLQNALKKAEAKKDKKSVALLSMQLSKNYWYQSDHVRALWHFETGSRISKSVSDLGLKRSVVTYSTFFHYWQGMFQKAVTIYENEVQGIDKDPQGDFPLMAVANVGYCFTFTGQLPHGLGIIDMVRSLSISRGLTFIKAYADSVLASALLDMKRVPEAMDYIDPLYREAGMWPDSPLLMFATMLRAYSHFLNKNKDDAVHYLKKYVRQQKRLKVKTIWPTSYLLELMWAVENEELPPISGMSAKNEIDRAIKTGNVFLMGIGYRYQALLQQKNNISYSLVLKSLRQSEKWLEKSGHQVELARTRQVLSDHYFSNNKIEMGRKTTLRAAASFFKSGFSFVPDDLKQLIRNRSEDRYLIESLIETGHKITTINTSADRVYELIATASRVLGAERGAVFLPAKNGKEQDYQLLAARSLSSEQISHGDFKQALDAIQQVVKTGKGIVWNQLNTALHPVGGLIRSFVCAPIVFSSQCLGVLYLDRRILLETFKNTDLELLFFHTALIGMSIITQTRGKELRSILSGKLEDNKDKSAQRSRHGMVGNSKMMEKVFYQIEQVADTDATVLIQGETGVGKELVAQAVHRASQRSGGPFVAVNCNALPGNLISSELFGHEKGAFTDAVQQRIGRFELADQGTLFIDEIGEMPLETQIQLLRVLQEKEFERIGGTRTIASDFRLIVATNRQLDLEVQNGRFRSDLFFRLNTFPILVAPLRDRKEDIPLLAHHFLRIHSLKMGKKFSSFPENEMSLLVRYDWPGNVRELEHAIERGVILSPGPLFQVPELTVANTNGGAGKAVSGMSMSEMEKHHIVQILSQTGWKIRGTGGAAKVLDIHPSTLYSRIKKLGIKKSDI